MKQIRVGIVANEFFDPSINRVGGFGWAGRRAMEAFRKDKLFSDPVYFSGEVLKNGDPGLSVDGIPIINRKDRYSLHNIWRARRNNVDVLLCIDYRPDYLPWLVAMPRTPAIVWVRDPRTREDMQRLKTLRIPGKDIAPGGIVDWDFNSLARFMHKTRFLRRPVVLANKMAYMREKIPGTFGLPPSDIVLPNPDVVDYSAVTVRKSERPTVVSLARLDPVKRPWLFVQLAKSFPEADFFMLGKGFVDGDRGWTPENLPANLKLLGNVSGQEKLDILSSAWVLVNTAIHEESAVSMMEALAYEVPIISFIESDGLSERFGTCLGYDTGTGIESLPQLRDALSEMLHDEPRRKDLGQKGRAWVSEEHNTNAFLESFKSICAHCGIRTHGRG
jgi:glycosyltransferase involved in cell wall biosynthesis